MSRLVVLTTPELALGYRLAGATTVGAESAAAAAQALDELVQRELGVIAVHEPYFHALDRAAHARIDALRQPLVVPLPAGQSTASAGERRERLLQMLWQAVGYEITFDSERNNK